MKFLGWLLFLIAIGLGLLFYNIRYLPILDEYAKTTNENLMWQAQVKELEEKLNKANQPPAFTQTLLWDDLFVSQNSFNLTEPAQVMLKELISRLQQATGDIIIAGHSDNQPILSELKRTYPSDRELSFAKAMAVLDYLQSCGISRDRLVCIGYGSSKPIESNETLEGKSRNRRVEIIVKELSSTQSSTSDSIISPASN